jgi:hypothetical protein
MGTGLLSREARSWDRVGTRLVPDRGTELDSKEPLVTTPPRYDIPPTRVSRHSLYSLVADEAFRDGQLEPWEARLLEAVAVAFELTPGQARQRNQRAIQRYRAGKLGSRRPLDPRHLMVKVLAAVGPEGPADFVEEARVEALRRLLDLAPEDLDELRGEAETHRLRWARMVSSVGLAAACMEPDAPESVEQDAPVEALRYAGATRAVVHVPPGEAEEPETLSLSFGDVRLRLSAEELREGVWETARTLEEHLGVPVELDWTEAQAA